MSKLSCLKAGILIASELCSSFPRWKEYAALELSSETQQTRIMLIIKGKMDLKRIKFFNLMLKICVKKK